VSISVSARKAKGRKLQQIVRDFILKVFPTLTSRDVVSCSMGDTGSDVKLSESAFKLFPYDLEAKFHNKFVIYTHFKQRHNPQGERLLVIKANHEEPLAIITLDHFMELVKRAAN